MENIENSKNNQIQKIQIIHKPSENEPFVIINKPQNLASAPLKQDETNNALYQTSLIYPEILNVTGKKLIEKGLLHRLDTQTNGLLMFATTQNFYDFVQNEQSQKRFVKTYLAKCKYIPQNKENLTGFPENSQNQKDWLLKLPLNESLTISSYFRNFSQGFKEVRPVTKESGKTALKKCKSNKEYSTLVKIISKNNNEFLIECKIAFGYRHQVRCHLAWLGLPVIGDNLYNLEDKNKINTKLEFSATELEFYNSEQNKKFNFKLNKN